MGTISIQVVETGQTTATKSYSIPDSQIDRLVSAYQSGANTVVNGTATRAQVLNYWANKLIQEDTVQYVLNSEQQVATTTALNAVSNISPV